MEDRKELSEILLGNTKQTSSGKKAVFVVIAALVIIGVVAFSVWKFLGTKEDKSISPNEIVDTDIMKPLDSDFSTSFNGLDFNENKPIDSFDPPSMPQDMGFGQEGMPNDVMSGLNAGGQSFDGNSSIDEALQSIENTIKAPITKPESKPSEPKVAESKSTESKPQASAKTPKPESKPAQQLNEPTKVAESKSKSVEPKVAQPKPTPKQEPLTQKPANQAPNAKNGTVPTSGFYWQVGSFQKEPNEKFNTLIKKYPYRVQHAKSDSNTPITRYLIGPYKSRVEAPSKEEIGRIFEQDPTPVEIQ